MALSTSKLATALAGVAAVSLTAAPAAAAELPSRAVIGASVYDADAQNAWQYRDRRYDRRYDRDRGISTGDVIAGIAVIGAIAAIASTSSNNRDNDRDYRDRNYRSPTREDARYRDNSRAYDSSGMERAVDMCVDQVERGRERVENVERADRNASGWLVAGRVASGDRFTCTIDNDGRIRSIDLDNGYSSYDAGSSNGRQLSDADYARARAATRYGTSDQYVYRDQDDRYAGDRYADDRYADDRYADQPQPAYPGGPLPGEEGYEEYRNDGRYATR